MPPTQPPAEPQWPPRSPHEVLLNTPGGREKLRRLAERTSPSPSPARGRTPRTSSAALLARAAAAGVDMAEDEGDEDEDEDEEMLQLKLQEIQAKLKLKKLQSARAAASSSTASSASRPSSGMENAALRPSAKISSAAAGRTAAKLPAAQSQAAPVEVPASPVKKAPPPPKSPLKVQLGIDKGLRAKDVSLKRSSSALQQRMQQQQQERQQTSNHTSADDLPARPLSFSERLALKRSEEAALVEKQQRLQKIRSSAFALDRKEMEKYKAAAEDLPDFPERQQTYSRADIVGDSRPPKEGGYLKRSNTAPSIRRDRLASSDTGNASLDSSATAGGEGNGSSSNSKATTNAPEDASFEPYSGFHLKKRILPHHVLTRSINGKQLYLIKDLMRKVKAPTWDLPDDECDIVVFAVLASKSDPRSHKPRAGDGEQVASSAAADDRGKYMVLTLTDLKLELELFLFNSGFDRYWKLVPGTVLAILNPVIMRPPKGREATGRFSLVINSDEDAILEVGTARDLGFCQATRRDGTHCPSWVNSHRTEFCEFHSNEAIDKARASRMELNGFGFGGGNPKYKKNSRVGRHAPSGNKAVEGSYDRDTQSRFFVSRPSAHAGAADDADRDGGFLESVERKEALKRKLARQEQEREVARKLGSLGAGAGRDYMRRRAPAAPTVAPTAIPADGSAAPAAPAAVLDLLGRRLRNPADIDLGPVKRKRPDSATSNSTTGSLGWGSALKDRLGRMKSDAARPLDHQPPPSSSSHPAALSSLSSSSSFSATTTTTTTTTTDRRSPVRKKTRFVTKNGIREAGRESLGTDLMPADDARGRTRRVVTLEDGDDDDEELVVV